MILEKKKILDIDFSDIKSEEVLEYLEKKLQKRMEKGYIVTPNPELLMVARKDDKFKQVLNRADLALPDGVGVLWASKILGKPLKERITGVGLMEKVCREMSKRPITVGFLGGKQNVAVETAECLRKKYPGLKVVYVGEEWPKNEIKNLKLKIKTFHIDILFVAFGSPKQELWISENLEKLPVKVAIGVGGAFDFISGRVKRAPLWVQSAGFEWFYRLIKQPWRIKRQSILPLFVLLVVKERFLKS